MTIKMKYKKRTNYRFLLTELLTNICFYVLNEKFKLVVTFDKNIIIVPITRIDVALLRNKLLKNSFCASLYMLLPIISFKNV